MPTSPIKNFTTAVLLIIIVASVFYGGFVAGTSHVLQAQKISNIINQDLDKPENVDFSLFWKTWNLVNENYVATHNTATSTPITSKDRVYGAIQGMVASLGDPYTTFFTPVQNTAFQTQIDANFEGVGMEMGVKDGVLTVISALPGSPAKAAGIQSGDKVIKIDSKDATGMTVDEAVGMIRGKKGTSVSLQIIRDPSITPIEIKIVRDVINLPVIDSSLDKTTNIFTIHLYSFSTDSANLFRGALRQFVMSGSNKLILDLRGNPGGLLDSAVDIASWFLPPGQVIVRESYGNGKDEVVEKSHGYNIFNNNLKMVILMDQGSASASEILAGALQEHGKAILVGTRSFGKGSVQELLSIDDKTSLKVTIARWLTPSGKSISAGGLTPDVVVKLTDEDITNHNDAQMKKAVEILSKP